MYNAPMKPRKPRPVRPKLPQGRTTSVPVVKKPARSLRPVSVVKKPVVKKTAVRKLTAKPTKGRATPVPVVKKTTSTRKPHLSFKKNTQKQDWPSLKEQEHMYNTTLQYMKWKKTAKSTTNSDIEKWWNAKGYSKRKN